MEIPFCIPWVSGKERSYLDRFLQDPAFSASDGHFTKACVQALGEQLGLDNVLFTPSGTAALELAAMITVRPGDEVIVPSYTFVTTVSSFVRAGAKPVFCDIRSDTQNIDDGQIEQLITDRTCAIVAVHYAGVGCAMSEIMRIADEHDLIVVEDAAQGLSGSYRNKALGGLGNLACFSFHYTKNYQCGEGGAIVVNDASLMERAEICREKGTNRKAFDRGQTDKYTWVDQGSSFLPSEISMAFLAGQLEDIDVVRLRRKALYESYLSHLAPLENSGSIRLPIVPMECDPSYHMFYILAEDAASRDALLEHLQSKGIGAVFHYVPLHSSPAGQALHDGRAMPVTEDHQGRILRLPLYPDLKEEQVLQVCEAILSFYGGDS